MRGTWLRFAVAAAVGLTVIAGASAAGTAGGRTISNAPAVPLNKQIRAHLFPAALYAGFSAEYWTVDPARGTLLTVKLHSLGEKAPCHARYLPGTPQARFGRGE